MLNSILFESNIDVELEQRRNVQSISHLLAEKEKNGVVVIAWKVQKCEHTNRR